MSPRPPSPDVVPEMMRISVKHKMRMPREFVLITKQLVYLDRYAKALGGPSMNVLTPMLEAPLAAHLACFRLMPSGPRC